MSKVPSDRFESIYAFVEALERSAGKGAAPRAGMALDAALSGDRGGGEAEAGLARTPPAQVASEQEGGGRGPLRWLALALLLLGGSGYLGWTLVGQGAGDAKVVEERAPAEASLEARHEGDEDPATGSSEADSAHAATSKTRELVADDAPVEQAPAERAADEGARTSQHDDPDPDGAEPTSSVQERAPQRRAQASRGLSPEAREKLEAAEAALAEGDAGGATRLGRASLRVQRSQRARAVLAKAACLRHDIGLANAMARGVRGKPRREAARFCKAQGITLR